MGLSLIFFLALFIVSCFAVTLLAIKPDNVKPSKWFYSLFTLTVINWSGFLTGSFMLFPQQISLLVWNSCWLVVLLLGIIAIVYEWGKSKALSILALLITAINGGFYLLARFIASM